MRCSSSRASANSLVVALRSTALALTTNRNARSPSLRVDPGKTTILGRPALSNSSPISLQKGVSVHASTRPFSYATQYRWAMTFFWRHTLSSSSTVSVRSRLCVRISSPSAQV